MNAQEVKKIRLEMGLTQREFSLKIGLKTQSALSKIEDGMLDASPYSQNIKQVFDEYKKNRINHFQNEIEFLNRWTLN